MVENDYWADGKKTPLPGSNVMNFAKYKFKPEKTRPTLRLIRGNISRHS